jgi:hypothetical protein
MHLSDECQHASKIAIKPNVFWAKPAITPPSQESQKIQTNTNKTH